MAPRNITTLTFRRHSNRNPAGQITPEGIRKSRNLGRSISKNKKIKVYSSPEDRAVKTAQGIVDGFKSKRGAVASTFGKDVGVRKSLDNFKIVVRDKQKVMKILEGFKKKPGSENKFMRQWLDGNISKDIMMPPNEYADLIIKDRLKYVTKFVKGKIKSKKYNEIKQLRIENVTHAWILELVFERLTGIKYNSLGSDKMANYREAVNFYFHPDKRVVIEYRKKSVDVTDKLYEILNAK